MTTQLAERQESALATVPSAGAVEAAIMGGCMSRLSPAQRLDYYAQMCQSLGLNPLTKPFQFIEFWGPGGKKLTLYPTKNCAEQLRALHGVSVVDIETWQEQDALYCRCKVADHHGRTDIATAVLRVPDPPARPRQGPKDKDWNNYDRERLSLPLKLETKAKRRATLSLCGLGWATGDQGRQTGSISYEAATTLEHPTVEPHVDLSSQIWSNRDETWMDCRADDPRHMQMLRDMAAGDNPRQAAHASARLVQLEAELAEVAELAEAPKLGEAREAKDAKDAKRTAQLIRRRKKRRDQLARWHLRGTATYAGADQRAREVVQGMAAAALRDREHPEVADLVERAPLEGWLEQLGDTHLSAIREWLRDEGYPIDRDRGSDIFDEALEPWDAAE